MVSYHHLMAIGWQQVSPRNTNVRLLHWICGGLLWQDTVFLLESGSVSVWNMQESGSDEECYEESSSSAEEEDAEFSANEEDGMKPKSCSSKQPNCIYNGNDCGINIFCPFSAEDEEDTIADQEKVEVNVDHAEELNDLAKEGNLCIYYGFNWKFFK